MKIKRFMSQLGVFVVASLSAVVYAQDQTIGELAQGMITSMKPISDLVVSICYVSGIAFAGAGILKFKQHKENPQQVTLGVPFMLLFIGIALTFLPTAIKSTGATIFGAGAQPGGVEGGDIFQ